MIGTLLQNPLYEMVDSLWIQVFTNRFRIVSYAHAAELFSIPVKEMEVGVSDAAHIERLSGLFAERLLVEFDVEIAVETYFPMEVNDGRNLSFCGGIRVKFADMISGGED